MELQVGYWSSNTSVMYSPSNWWLASLSPVLKENLPPAKLIAQGAGTGVYVTGADIINGQRPAL